MFKLFILYLIKATVWVPLITVLPINNKTRVIRMLFPERKLCPTCNGARPVAINRHVNGKTYYRRQCDCCLRAKKKLKPPAPAWFLSGYRKKERCEKCGFKAKFPEDQLRVFYLDGNLKNNNWANLKTLCLNCQQEVHRLKLPWKPADLIPDF